jgi:glycosyltransferase involved in cell wall biosynthesis
MFSDVTLLITHYNRSQSLQRLLQNFVDQGIQFGGIVVSDDCSRTEHLNRLEELKSVYNYQLVTTPQNRGLGNNINKGQDAVKTPYTLYVQEDFDPFPGYAEHLQDALDIMNDRPDVDICRFYAYSKYPYLKPFRKGFSEMQFKLWYPGSRKFHVYSDHPHLRRSTFLEKFGRYCEERLNVEKIEFLMVISFLKKKGKGMFYENYTGLFDQLNTAAEPSTMKRTSLRHRNDGVIGAIKEIYRNIVHTFKVLF